MVPLTIFLCLFVLTTTTHGADITTDGKSQDGYGPPKLRDDVILKIITNLNKLATTQTLNYKICMTTPTKQECGKQEKLQILHYRERELAGKTYMIQLKFHNEIYNVEALDTQKNSQIELLDIQTSSALTPPGYGDSKNGADAELLSIWSKIETTAVNEICAGKKKSVEDCETKKNLEIIKYKVREVTGKNYQVEVRYRGIDHFVNILDNNTDLTVLRIDHVPIPDKPYEFGPAQKVTPPIIELVNNLTTQIQSEMDAVQKGVNHKVPFTLGRWREQPANGVIYQIGLHLANGRRLVQIYENTKDSRIEVKHSKIALSDSLTEFGPFKSVENPEEGQFGPIKMMDNITEPFVRRLEEDIWRLTCLAVRRPGNCRVNYPGVPTKPKSYRAQKIVGKYIQIEITANHLFTVTLLAHEGSGDVEVRSAFLGPIVDGDASTFPIETKQSPSEPEETVTEDPTLAGIPKFDQLVDQGYGDIVEGDDDTKLSVDLANHRVKDIICAKKSGQELEICKFSDPNVRRYRKRPESEDNVDQQVEVTYGSETLIITIIKNKVNTEVQLKNVQKGSFVF